MPDSMGIFKLLEALKASHRHMAVVLDEFGAVEGLVTVTDLLEAFVGSPADRRQPRAGHRHAGPTAAGWWTGRRRSTTW